MTLPAAYNPIGLLQTQGEFGGTNPIAMSEYYRGGAYTTNNNTTVPTGSAGVPIGLSNFYSAWRGVLVTMYYYREADQQNVFYLSASGFPTITITTPYNNTSSQIDGYIAPNVDYIITSNANTSILPANFVEEISYDEYDNATYNYTWPTPITGMWLEDGGGLDYNDLQWSPGAGTIYDGGDGNFYYVLNV
jgi:hypothetical protein